MVGTCTSSDPIGVLVKKKACLKQLLIDIDVVVVDCSVEGDGHHLWHPAAVGVARTQVTGHLRI